jgi:hypothetical protein
MAAKTPEPFPTLKDLPLDSIRMDGGTQPRVRIDEEIVREYAERMRAGDHFPPVQVYFDGTDHWLSDGFHRVRAAREAEKPTIQAEVWEGTRDDAFWMSLGANKDHGLRRTNDDKARAVKAALVARPSMSDRQIADHVGVHFDTVAKYRAELKTTGTIGNSDSRTGRDGRTINTANIGKTNPTSSGPPIPDDDIPLDLPSAPQTAAPVSGGAPATEVTTDQIGHAVEGAVAVAFQRRQEIQALLTTVSKVKTTVLKAIESKDLLFADLNPSRFEAECNSVYHQLKAAMPYAACPYCRAAGCKVCLGRGWVNEGVYERAPKELKAS